MSNKRFAELEEAQRTIDEQMAELERAKESDHQLQQRLNETQGRCDAWYTCLM